jgi:hypothetical protein
MTEKELIAKRLAGASYKELAKLSGFGEGTVFKLLRGKVPGRVSKVPTKVRVASRASVASPERPGPETMESYISRTGWDDAKLAFPRRRGKPQAQNPNTDSADSSLLKTGAVGTTLHPYVVALYRLIRQSIYLTAEEFDAKKAGLKEKFKVGAGGSTITDAEHVLALEARDKVLEEEYYALPKPRPPLSKWLPARGHSIPIPRRKP